MGKTTAAWGGKEEDCEVPDVEEWQSEITCRHWWREGGDWGWLEHFKRKSLGTSQHLHARQRMIMFDLYWWPPVVLLVAFRSSCALVFVVAVSVCWLTSHSVPPDATTSARRR